MTPSYRQRCMFGQVSVQLFKKLTVYEMVVPFYSQQWDWSSSSTFSPASGSANLFTFRYSNRYVMHLIVVSVCISLMPKDFEHPHVLIPHPHTFFGEVSLQIFCPFLKWVVSFLGGFESCKKYILFKRILYQICDLKIFLPICGLSFHF